MYRKFVFCALILFVLSICFSFVSFEKHVRATIHENGSSLSFSPDGRKLASAGDLISLWDTTTGKLIQPLREILGWIR